MVRTLPDWWYKGRAPQTIISPLQIKFVGTATPAYHADLTYYVLIGPIKKGQVLYLHNFWLSKTDNALALIQLCWPVSPDPEDAPGGDVVTINGVPHYYYIITRERGYEEPRIEYPKGLDYHEDWYILAWIQYYWAKPDEHQVNFSGVIEWL